MNSIKNFLTVCLFVAVGIGMTSCGDDNNAAGSGDGTTPITSDFAGAVYAMSNGSGQVDGNVQGDNWIAAYGRAADGTLTLIERYGTGGQGGDFDGGEGLDPLISAYALNKTADNRFLLAVNAGSNTLTAMAIEENTFGLGITDTEPTNGIGPNSVAHTGALGPDGVNGLVYVSNITREEFADQGEPAQQGSLMGYWLLDDGTLQPIEGAWRALANRPSAVQFSPNGDFLVVASINAGSSALASDDQNEIVVYRVNENGTLSADITAGATSTLRDDGTGRNDGRNLPSAIGFQIVGDNYVVVTEAREFQPDGTPPAFSALQDGSVACWLDFTEDGNAFFVSNAIEAGLASYSFNNGVVQLLDQTAAQGVGATGNTTDPAAAFGTTQGWIDMWISDDGEFLYQLHGLAGTIGVYQIDGTSLTLVEEVTGDLPTTNTQGIVAL